MQAANPPVIPPSDPAASSGAPSPARRPAIAWALSDGKAGDELQCVAIIEALGLAPDIRRIAPRRPWSWLAPWGPMDPAEAPGRAGGPLAGPLPDLLVASGRRAIPAVRAIRRASGGQCFTVILKDPRTGAGAADFIWVPAHDRMRGANVFATLTSPHRLSPARLEAARAAPLPALAAAAHPRVAVLLGGDSRRHRFSERNIADLVARLRQLAADGASLMITTSRRTPPALREAVAELASCGPHVMWDAARPPPDMANPYVDMLALADFVVVTTDSTNMLSEAAATGAPLLAFAPDGDDRKTAALLAGLRGLGAVQDFTGRLAGHAYPPINSTPIIADKIRLALGQAGLDPATSASPTRIDTPQT